MVTPASDCEADSPSPERNHKVARVIGELPIAQYSGSPRRYGVRENPQLPSLLSSPSMYMTPRPGFPQRVLPTTPNHNEVCKKNTKSSIKSFTNGLTIPNISPICFMRTKKEDISAEIVVDKTVIENISTEDQSVNPSPPSPKVEEEEDDSLKPSTLPADNISSLVSPGGSTFDYLYEFSETRKVLEEFFKCPAPTKEKENNIESFPFQVSSLSICFLGY